MRPTESITALAKRMVEGRESEDLAPLTLFLGEGCARAARVPTLAEIARDWFSDAVKAPASVPPLDLDDEEALLRAFYGYLGRMSPGDRHRLLQSYYTGVPVPSFYQDLAMLVRGGYFEHILTTNVDTLLEQALNGAGLWQDKDFQVVGPGSRDRATSSISLDRPGPRVAILKLHGDLARREVAITPEEIERALKPMRRPVKAELAGEIVMVGYLFESGPVNRWLRWTPGVLWWVSEEPPDPQQIGPFAEKRKVIRVHGENARPEALFGQLGYLLQRRPVLKLRTDAEQALVEPSPERRLDAEPLVPKRIPGDDYSDAEYLQGQLRRSQGALYSLQQSAIPGEKNAHIQAQIDYQRRQIAELEDQLRGLSESRERVLVLMRQVRDSARDARTDPNAVSFLQNQVETVSAEYRRDPPSQLIVSASVDATVVLAERLGPDVVRPELVHELASFAPSASAKRVP